MYKDTQRAYYGYKCECDIVTFILQCAMTFLRGGYIYVRTHD